MGERNSERRGLLICTAVLFSLCLFFFIFYGKEIIVNGSQAGEEYVKELMGGEEYAALEQRVQQILHAEKFSLTDYIRAVLSGETAFSFSDFVRTVSRGMVGQVEGLRRDFVQLIALVLLTSVFNGFAKAFRDGQVAESGYYVSYLLLFSMLASGYLSMSGVAEDTLNTLLGFMKVLIPVFCGTIAFATGSITSQSAAAVLFMLLAAVDYFLVSILLPVIHIYMMTVLANHLAKEEPLGKTAQLLAKGVRFFLKFALSIVAAASTLLGLVTPAIDALKRGSVLKVSQMIPGLGNLFRGVAETVFGAGNIIKNAVGTGGMIVVVLICIIPLGRVLLASVCYRAGAAAVEPVADRRIVNCLTDAAEGITMLFQTLFAGAVLFLLIFAVLLRATS